MSDLISPSNVGIVKITIQLSKLAYESNNLYCIMDDIQEMLTNFGKVLSFSYTWQDIYNPRLLKFFVEYYDSHASQHVYERLSIMKLPPDYDIQLEFVSLCLNDRNVLFFSPREKSCLDNNSKKSSPTNSTAVPSSFRSHKHSHSIISISNSLISQDLPSEKSLIDDYHGEDHHVPENNKYELDLDRIANGSDPRTTCMIKNIPNKYTQQMLIEFLNETHKGRYDFIYLRMDFKNKCNVGYAFINFVSPLDILSFANRMLGRKWPKFNSEKVCALAYARIQGKVALIDKFRNSRVMQEPPNFRPKVFSVESGECTAFPGK